MADAYLGGEGITKEFQEKLKKQMDSKDLSVELWPGSTTITDGVLLSCYRDKVDPGGSACADKQLRTMNRASVRVKRKWKCSSRRGPAQLPNTSQWRSRAMLSRRTLAS